MYQFLVLIQFLGIIILFFELVYIFSQKPSTSQSLLSVITIGSLINTVGYLFELTSKTQDTALLSVKITYLGKVYILLGMFLFVLRYCHVHLPKWIIGFLFTVHTSIAILVFTCDFHNLYYRSISYSYDGFFPHLVVEHGFFYYFYLVFVVVYMITMPIVCMHRYKRTTDTVERRQIIYLFIMALIPFIGFFIFLTGITDYYDITAMNYVVSDIILLFSIFRNNLFDTLELAKDNVVENLDNGIVVLDNTGSLLYANAPAKELFPQLDEKKNKQIIDEILSLAESDSLQFHDENVYEMDSSPIYYNQMLRGKMVQFHDITESYHYTRTLEKAVKEKTKDLEHMQKAVITSFADMIEARDGATGLHVKRTSSYVEILTRTLKDKGYYPEELDDNTMQEIIDAAPLHDIGKIAIPDAILCKPGKLTSEEFDIIKTHAAIGGKMIDEILQEVEHTSYLTVAKDMATYHHEKWDGSGYPAGLSRKDIPLCARIMAIADVYDALISERCYKKGMPHEQAQQIIREESGTHFDPLITSIFFDVIDQIEQVSADSTSK